MLRPFRSVYSRQQILLWREVIPFTWPILIELTCVVLMGMISTILVSRLGKSETAAVGISDSVTYIIFSIQSAIALGGSVLIAQALGRRNRQKSIDGARQVMNLNICFSVLSAILIVLGSEPLLEAVALGADPEVKHLAEQYLRLIAMSYPALGVTLAGSGILRAAGNTRLPMLINIGMNLLNIIFSYPLIYGITSWTGIGLSGAGIGVILSRYIGAAVLIVYLAVTPEFCMTLRGYWQPFSRIILRDILNIGIPASIESLMFNVGKLITQLMVAGMGTVAMAGNVITFSLLLLINLPGNALATAATILVGKRLGQQRPRVATSQLKMIFWLSTGLLCLLGLLSVPIAAQLAGLYTQDQDVIHVVKQLLYLNALLMPVWAASFVLPSGFKGARDAKFCMWTAIASMWGCRICCGYIFGILLDWGVYGVWFGMFADWVIRGMIYFIRLLNGRWLKRSMP